MKALVSIAVFSLFQLTSFSVEAVPLPGAKLARLAASCLNSFQGRSGKPLSLLKELSGSDIEIKSTIHFDRWGLPYSGPFMPSESSDPTPKNEPAEYGFIYSDPTNKKDKGRMVLSFHIKDTDFYHWIHWPSDMAEPDLSEDTVKAVFKKVYEEVYGIDPDRIAEHGIIQSVLSFGEKNNIQGWDIIDALKADELIFRNKEEKLKQIIKEALKSPHKSANLHSTAEGLSPALIKGSKMPPLMKRAAMASLTPKELKGFSDQLKQLSLEELNSLYDSPDKMKTLDMRSVSPQTAVRLLSESRAWRETVTRDQVRQLDVRAPGIQYIFSPTFKHFSFEAPSKTINIDTLTDEQITNMDRDTFLRDVFLAGDIYVDGYLPHRAHQFRLQCRERVKELGLEQVMNDSLPGYIYNFIARKLGFSGDFDSMSTAEKRKLFKKEIAMMTDARLQREIIGDEGFEEAVVLSEQEAKHLLFFAASPP